MSTIEMSFRPDTYWPESLTPEQRLSRISGKTRQEIARDLYAKHGFSALNEFLVREGLDEEERTAWGAVGPWCMGGEYLPPLAEHTRADALGRLAEHRLVTVEKDNNGNILNIGRRSRTVPPAIRRALSIRDHCCRVPGCCELRYVDAHHIHHWADGGETSLDNLVTLCRHHHRLLHRGVFTIEATEKDGERQLLFRGPDGEVMQGSYFPQFKNVSAETHLAVGVLSPEVGERTCVTRWRGENCDYGMAVEVLLGRGQVAHYPSAFRVHSSTMGSARRLASALSSC